MARFPMKGAMAAVLLVCTVIVVLCPRRADAEIVATASPAVVGRGGAGGRKSTGGGGMTDPTPQSMSIFGPEEKELDRYSAALAGTHFLRQERDKTIKDTTNPLAHLYLSMTKRDQHNRWMSSPWISDKARQAQKHYLIQAGNIIRSNGLTTARYNELSHILGKQKELRERVQQQAYLYRVNADLRGDKIYPLVDLSEGRPPSSSPSSASSRAAGRTGARSTGNQGISAADQRSKPPLKMMLFAKSLREIEALRHRQRNRLMNEIGADELPEGICRASMGRIAPRFRKACERFPVIAENVVRANGLNAEEFNRQAL